MLALCQQIAVLKRKRSHPKLNSLDRLFWTALRRVWSGWSEALRRGDPGKRWMAFLRNHREAIVALDFFTVPHTPVRRVVPLVRYRTRTSPDCPFHVTQHPDSDWVIQQLREACHAGGSLPGATLKSAGRSPRALARKV
jgi:hypothetical protein